MPGPNTLMALKTPSTLMLITRCHSAAVVRRVFDMRSLITPAEAMRMSASPSGPSSDASAARLS